MKISYDNFLKIGNRQKVTYFSIICPDSITTQLVITSKKFSSIHQLAREPAHKKQNKV